jgi:two-component system sensor histidine kinase/response regulator
MMNVKARLVFTRKDSPCNSMNQKKKTILIVDDNPMNLLLTSHVLENEGYATLTADDGRAALKELEKQTPSLILLDVMMPEMDGYEVCRLINANEEWTEIPIIFLTANAQTENLVEGFKAGGVDYITKPFKGEELLVRVKNHLELADSKKMIVEMNKSRDKLYSIIAHDIRSPLSGILQTVDAIDQGYFDPNSDDFRELIHHLKIRTKETSTLLTSLLQWTRLQSEEIQLDLKQNDISVVIKSCIQLLEANAHDKDIRLIYEDTLPGVCIYDEVSMHTVIRNIISNAIKFTPISGSITIRINQTGTELQISIQDTGIGMSDEVIKTIFERNQHFSSSGTANEQGTGLGLMLVKDFVKKNNGQIMVNSSIGQGTIFTISLPTN